MNKTELIEKISKDYDCTKKEAQVKLESVLNTIEEVLSSGEKIQIPGFGSFEVKERAAREGRNPKDPTKTIHIPASKTVSFKVGKTLKEKVNN